MTDLELKNIDEYGVFLTETLTPWSTQQHLAFAAAVAESWFPSYESFAEEEEWGDPDALSHALDAVWGHLSGNTLSKSDTARYEGQIDDITPHMDDFDSIEALMACVTVSETLQACGDPQNSLAHVSNMMLGVVENLVDDWPMEPAAQSRVWRKAVIRNEVQAQLKLIERINEISRFDEPTSEELREFARDLKSRVVKKPKEKPSPGLTNQVAFEQYRRYVESDLRGKVETDLGFEPGSFGFGMMYLSYWSGRYSRREQTLDGSYGKLADQTGLRAVIARNAAIDEAVTELPDWDGDVRLAIDMCLQNTHAPPTDANDLADIHTYGPSLRRLWQEGIQAGGSEEAGWQSIQEWGNHIPAAWIQEDQRKKKGQAYSRPELGDKLAQNLTWQSTSDPLHPWSAEVDGNQWQVRINDFPDELMYSLLIDGETAGDFHDWPENWARNQQLEIRN